MAHNPSEPHSKGPGTPPHPIPEVEEIDKGEERRLRAKAKSRRFLRALRLLIYSVLLMLAFFAMVAWIVLEDCLAKHIGMDPKNAHYLDIPLVVTMAISVVYTATFYISKRYYWPRYLAEAAQFVDTDKCVEGFIQLFRTYVGTRQAGTYAYLWSAWGIIAILSLLGFHGLAIQKDGWHLGAIVLLGGLSALNFLLGMFVSNNFLVGTVVVDVLSKMSYRAANPYQDADADHATQGIRTKLRREFYWWFY